eukprot:GHVR01128155.1.p1 GENE.GHVR01128155.1~~GHVR01128155.1.p1  ORF type:complete len:122 (-),score=74.18 GHVR01128155.1:127-492(-)
MDTHAHTHTHTHGSKQRSRKDGSDVEAGIKHTHTHTHTHKYGRRLDLICKYGGGRGMRTHEKPGGLTRVLVEMTHTALSTSAGRTILAVYLLATHILVFIALWRAVHCRHYTDIVTAIVPS